MKPNLLHLGLSLLAGVSLITVTAVFAQDDDESFQKYGQVFKGKIGRTYEESVEWYPETTQPKSGTPNVLIILLDDVGYSQIGSYGGLSQTPSEELCGGSPSPPALRSA